MRVVAGTALVVRAGLTLLRSDPPPMNVTIPAILLLGAGILPNRRLMDTRRGHLGCPN